MGWIFFRALVSRWQVFLLLRPLPFFINQYTTPNQTDRKEQSLLLPSRIRFISTSIHSLPLLDLTSRNRQDAFQGRYVIASALPPDSLHSSRSHNLPLAIESRNDGESDLRLSSERHRGRIPSFLVLRHLHDRHKEPGGLAVLRHFPSASHLLRPRHPALPGPRK